MSRSKHVLAGLAVVGGSVLAGVLLAVANTESSGASTDALSDANVSATAESASPDQSMVAEPSEAEPIQAAVPSCTGYYSYIPSDPERDVPFSVLAGGSDVKIQYMDWGRVTGARRESEDGRTAFKDEDGFTWSLRCNGERATLYVPAQTHTIGSMGEGDPPLTTRTPAQTVELVRTTGDIFETAAQRGWVVGD